MTKQSVLPVFDPRKIPVFKIDHDLPAIHPNQLQNDALRKRFLNPPKWQTDPLIERPYTQDQNPKPAAVLIPIVLRNEPSVLLTKRTQALSSHAGQIAFPGGRIDETDENATAAALREADEEIGLDAKCVTVLGSLPLYVTGSAYCVTPVIGLVQTDFSLKLNADEVSYAFEVPLAFLMNPQNHRHHTYEWQGLRRTWLSMPFWDEQMQTEHFIWGATAGMLRNFYRFLAADLD